MLRCLAGIPASKQHNVQYICAAACTHYSNASHTDHPTLSGSAMELIQLCTLSYLRCLTELLLHSLSSTKTHPAKVICHLSSSLLLEEASEQ